MPWRCSKLRKRRKLAPWAEALLEELMKPPYFFQNKTDPSGWKQSLWPLDKKYEEEEKVSEAVPVRPVPIEKTEKDVRPTASARSSKDSYPTHTPAKEAASKHTHRPAEAANTGHITVINRENKRENKRTAQPLPQVQRSLSKARSSSVEQRLEGLPRQVIDAYTNEFERLSKVNGVWKITTPEGSFSIKEAHVHPARLKILMDTLEFAKEQGFEGTPNIWRTKNAGYFVEYQQTVYYANHWINGVPANFTSLHQLGKVAYLLAELHEKTRTYKQKDKLRTTPVDLRAMMKRRKVQFEQVLNRTSESRQSKKINEWLQTHRSSLLQEAEESIQLLQSDACLDYLKSATVQAGLCHLDVIPRNFLYDGTEDRVTAIDFDLSAFAPRVLDMSHLLRRTLESTFWTSDYAYNVFVQYNEWRTMSKSEYTTLEALLRFPHHIWRILDSHLANTDNEMVLQQLHNYMQQTERRKQFLDSFHEQIQQLPD